MFPELILAAQLSTHPCVVNPKDNGCPELFASINQGDSVEGNSSLEWYHDGHKWNTRPRVNKQILVEAPTTPTTPTCKNPYSYAIGEPGNDCSNVQAPSYNAIGKPEWNIGVSYNPAYPGAIFTVTNISYSTKRPGVLIITGEWNTPDTMPISFYVDQQPGPFFKVQ